VLIGDSEISAARDDQLVTAAVPRQLLARMASEVAIAVADRNNGERMGVGSMTVID
jgi:hypothetical protein